MEELARRELDNIVQVQIACELLNGKRTAAEMVKALFGVNQGDPGYTTHYSQIDKELCVMGSRGLVSRKPFGRDKPYMLTQSALARITLVEDVKKNLSWRFVSRIDLLLYIIVLVFGFASFWMANNSAGEIVVVLTLFFVFTGGIAFCRFAQALIGVIS
jgi:hypothetical protein